jgi:SAM-dependent methyltransferase
MDLETLRSHWDRLGASDPLWSVLTTPGRRFGGWDEAEFFQTGVQEITRVFAELDDLGVVVAPGRALDFGCGVGRLTNALAERFKRVDAVDIAPSMLAEARRRFQANPRMHFHLLADDSLSLFPAGTFDFIYSAHVTQHMEPRYCRCYVGEFIRVLAPDGVAVLEMTTEPFISEGVTVADGCLRDDAYRARLGIALPSDLIVGQRVVVSALIMNESNATWPAGGTDGWFMVTLANRWCDANGAVITPEDGRTYLPRDVGPGESIVATLEATAPPVEGRYVLEVDLVQEGCTWFGDRGSTPARLAVNVRRPGPAPRAISAVTRQLPARVTDRLAPFLPEGAIPAQRRSSREDQPIMEMYGVPEPEMREWIEEAGGRVVDVFDWARVGDPGNDWVRQVFVFTPLSEPGGEVDVNR